MTEREADIEKARQKLEASRDARMDEMLKRRVEWFLPGKVSQGEGA